MLFRAALRRSTPTAFAAASASAAIFRRLETACESDPSEDAVRSCLERRVSLPRDGTFEGLNRVHDLREECRREVVAKAKEAPEPEPKAQDAAPPTPPASESASASASASDSDSDIFARLESEYDETDWSDLPAQDEDTECGFCLYMRASPCGNHFRRWEQCVNVHKKETPDEADPADIAGPGGPADPDDDFVARCALPTAGLARCMERNPEYFRDPPAPDAPPANDSSATAWEAAIAALEKADGDRRGPDAPFEPFPASLRPETEYRPTTGTARVTFRQPEGGEVMVGYLRDEGGRLLVAANGEQIATNPKGKDALVFTVPKGTKAVTMYALYSKEGGEEGPIYAHTEFLPEEEEKEEQETLSK